MNSNSIIVQEYLGSLKEDKELDYLFPLLLSVMGFRIVQTALESKGQSQYGKDIVAIGNDDNGNKFRWYFELKGFKDKNITDKNYSISDGIRESIIEAKDTAFNDSSIPEFDSLPIKIVVVHNGILKTNIRPTFDGFISREFKPGEFERWDIYYLTDLFSKYLFSEYLLADAESNRLLKRTLAFLDSPDNDFSDFKQLVEIQIDKTKTIKGRTFKKYFATLNLLSSIIFHYSNENQNLIAAKECSDYLVLRVWSWILKQKLEQKEAVLKEFRKLLTIQYNILDAYFKKTYKVASLENGLYAENGAFFEAIGYPLRCFDYINDIIYYCELRTYYPDYREASKHKKRLRNIQKDKIITLIKNNSGAYRPIIDNHSIAILNVFRFFSEQSDMRQKDLEFLASYIFGVINGLLIIKIKRNRLPDGYNRISLVSEFVATGEKPQEYTDESSMLIAILYELLIFFNAEETYLDLKKRLDDKVNLQIAHPSVKEFDIEQLLFERHMHSEYYIDSFQAVPDSFDEFKEKVKEKEYEKMEYRTDKAGFPFLRTLAHKYYKNEIFPDEWRKKIPSD
ncbi:hypothetical protein DWB61_17255 [Ancylomarina euxinus]|uniref:Uncharacterized protein n=1 Tax=Ancylomarina euxinus TaxID=2283627 RepID=A0A425XWJ0_9BACT|nr:hypothetical protein [Ancylomarina euxinus]MCZ4696415.1 hypothetical protein [Ancylomarina euxinus]RRG19006.1 hypothetical protein DWB61_17255 [Ancylomarina euxinus]